MLTEEGFLTKVKHSIMFEPPKPKLYWVYGLLLKDETIYIGVTFNPVTRLKNHYKEKGVKDLLFMHKHTTPDAALQEEEDLHKLYGCIYNKYSRCNLHYKK